MAEAKKRPVRKRVGTRNVLTAKKREGYQRRIVNIDGDNVEQMEGAGWTVVKDDTQIGDTRTGDGSQMGSAVTKSVGGGVKAVLMEIKNEWYEEDQAEKAAEIDESERSMHRNLNSGQGTYGKADFGR